MNTRSRTLWLAGALALAASAPWHGAGSARAEGPDKRESGGLPKCIASVIAGPAICTAPLIFRNLFRWGRHGRLASAPCHCPFRLFPRFDGGRAVRQLGLLHFLDWQRSGLLGALFHNPADPRIIVLRGIFR